MVNFQSSDHIDLEYSPNSERTSARKEVLSDISEEDDRLLEPQNGLSRTHDYVNRDPESPVKIRFYQEPKESGWWGLLVERFDH